MPAFYRTRKLAAHHGENKMRRLAPGICGDFTEGLNKSCEVSTGANLQQLHKYHVVAQGNHICVQSLAE